MRDEYRKVLMKNARFLQENTSLDKYLLTMLEAWDVIGFMERKRVMRGEIDEDKIRLLLEILMQKDDPTFRDFCSALKIDGQTFIAKRLEQELKSAASETHRNNERDQNTDERVPNTTNREGCCIGNVHVPVDDSRATGRVTHTAKVPDEEALLRKWHDALRRHRCALLDTLEATLPLLEKLYELEVLDRASKQTIAGKNTNYEKVSALLDYLQKRPKECLLDFREALVKDNQCSILDILDT